ncbi:hypothetical protein AGABI1DRAFT_135397 [Agaricus bisporus var. burnettii JB137-S8]|uniref:Uncharacterized protein n=1 Tax=Agaricus bisporus var. burnettii (strain JB137-S8 / ATCC MYA-4627 / FGSC 10392) TaxID=597362 RepID=K5XFQ2_AGABU|nr:uncharacterized protein AGABI1DRAFT_135397 [Agaricus bisporus var. burnettii JB137-S8]EKM73190.1 hypothetical protein AGABI1DRAFT_135397 [Agaricus bisporus var. burnettii JB137-S8]
MSIDISSQGLSGMGNGLSGMWSGRRIVLFFWHMSHPLTYLLISVLIVGHQKDVRRRGNYDDREG